MVQKGLKQQREKLVRLKPHTIVKQISQKVNPKLYYPKTPVRHW